MNYYVDTCIWLNLFKKETDKTGKIQYWQIAEDFIKQVVFSENNRIVYSGIVLRELQIKLGNYYEEKRRFFDETKFIKIDTIPDDKILARKLESKYNFEISFYDLLHLTLAKRLNLVLVTRDRQLISIATENNVTAIMPEQL